MEPMDIVGKSKEDVSLPKCEFFVPMIDPPSFCSMLFVSFSILYSFRDRYRPSNLGFVTYLNIQLDFIISRKEDA